MLTVSQPVSPIQREIVRTFLSWRRLLVQHLRATSSSDLMVLQTDVKALLATIEHELALRETNWP